MSKHIKPPYLCDNRTVYALNDHRVNSFSALVDNAHTPYRVLQDTAAFIVRACNSHDELLAAAGLADLYFQRNLASGNFQGDDEHEAWTALRAAIAKAGESS